MNIKSFKAAFPIEDLITSPESFFSSIKYQYREYRANGVYRDGTKTGYYIYRIKSQHGIHTGLICSTSVNDLHDNKIRMHEKTLSHKEQQMMHLLMQRKALVKPVLLGYHPNDGIDELLNSILETYSPEVDITFENGEEHAIWSVYEESYKSKIEKSFKGLKEAYVGDGHHRTTTVSLLNSSTELGIEAKKYSHLLTAYFPFNNLQIWDFNRVVDITEIMSSSELIALLSQFFNIKKVAKAQKPQNKHEVTFFIDDIWYSMVWKKKYTHNKKKEILDSALINKYVFKKILKIEDVRVDNRIKYYGGTDPISKIIKQAKKYKRGIGICIFPISIKELTSTADKGKTLPPKSTWFVPRLKSGIIAIDL